MSQTVTLRITFESPGTFTIATIFHSTEFRHMSDNISPSEAQNSQELHLRFSSYLTLDRLCFHCTDEPVNNGVEGNNHHLFWAT